MERWALNFLLLLLKEILNLGDEGVGGGLSVAGSSWDKEALAIAQQVLLSFDGVGVSHKCEGFDGKLGSSSTVLQDTRLKFFK
ncbi:hypothetical protein Tco_0842064 [Tanacetum coccineum]|uniref:Uncharacterized protein n=1 Tax=Tanacetum coccineum TaxID=301880 RepID=A0ABQ5B1P0_9ASTR